jgi:hypothetical protein
MLACHSSPRSLIQLTRARSGDGMSIGALRSVEIALRNSLITTICASASSILNWRTSSLSAALRFPTLAGEAFAKRFSNNGKEKFQGRAALAMVNRQKNIQERRILGRKLIASRC